MHLLPAFLGPNATLSAMFLKTTSICSVLGVRDHPLHPCETIG